MYLYIPHTNNSTQTNKQKNCVFFLRLFFLLFFFFFLGASFPLLFVVDAAILLFLESRKIPIS